MSHKLATSRPAWAVETSDNSRRLDGDGGRTAGTPPAGVGAAGASGNHACENPLRQASPGVPGAPTVCRWRKVFTPVSSSAQASGPKRARGHPSDGPGGAATDAPNPELKKWTFRFGTSNMLGRKFNSTTGLVPKFPFADDLMALERLDLLALQETHCDGSGPPVSRRSITLAHSRVSRLAAGIALLTPANSSWTCETSHTLIPGHALIARLYHKISTESIWVLCAYADSSRLIDFYNELVLSLSSFIASLPANTWPGCIALGDWNMVEHPHDCVPQKAPDSVFRRRLCVFADLKSLCCAHDAAGPGAWSRGISFHHRASNYSARLDRIYFPHKTCTAGRPVTVPTLWSDHSLVWAPIHITRPRVELAKAAPRLPDVPTLDAHKQFWPSALAAYEVLVTSDVTLHDWTSFKQTILEHGLSAKASLRSSSSRNWKKLLRGDLVPEDDLVDAIRHNGFSLKPPPKPRAPVQRWPSAVPDDQFPTPPPPPPQHSRWPAACPSLPPWRTADSRAASPVTFPVHSLPYLPPSATPPPGMPPGPMAGTQHAAASFLSMRAERLRQATLRKYRLMAATHSSAWFKLSSNKEADERGSCASISVEGLRRSPDDPASSRLKDMVVIACDFYHSLHTPLPRSAARQVAQDALIAEVTQAYSDLPAPTETDSPSGPFSLGEVLALKSKMPNSAPGPDGIQYAFWKALALRIDDLRKQGSRIPCFWSTYRRLTDDLHLRGTDRHGFKDANLSLFFKKGDPTLVANYRPISSMNTDCKMYTNLINAQLAPWAMTKLHPDQKGFVPLRYITEHTRLCSEVAHLCNKTGTPGYIVSLDQAKAYDRVDSALLLQTLEAMGLPADLIRLISDVLVNCRTRVRINGGYSGFFSLRRGVRQGDPLSCLLYDFSIGPMGMRLRRSISGISLLGLRPVKLIQYADNMNLFLSDDENLPLIHETMDDTSLALGSLFNLNKTDVLVIGPPRHQDSPHPGITDCFTGGFIIPQGLPLRVLGAWVGSPNHAEDRWEQIYSHIKKIIRQWNAIGASLLNRALLAKALLLSRCYYLLDCNGIPTKLLNKITNTICRFVRGSYSHMPYAFLSAPLALGGLNCPSLKERKLAYDAKFMSNLISPPFDVNWKLWTLADLSAASSKPGKTPGPSINPLLQRSIVKLSDLEPRVRHAYISCRTLRYDVSCAFPSMAARMDMLSTYHPAVPLRANRLSDMLVQRHVTNVRLLTWPGTKLTRAHADPMPMHQRGLLGSAGKVASRLYAHQRPFHRRPSPSPPDSDTDSDPDRPPPSPCRFIHSPSSAGSSSSSGSSAPLAAGPKALASTRMAIIKALSVTQWRNSKWWPDTSLVSSRIRAWPAMSNALGCVRLLNSPQSLFARPDRFGNHAANPRFFRKYAPPPPISIARLRRVPADWQHIWTDGSALNNGHPHCAAGAAWLSPCGAHAIFRLVGPRLSNNIAELCAAIKAVQAWPDQALHIHTDSSFVIGLVCGGLLAMERDGWHGFPPFSSFIDNNLGFSIPALGVHMAYTEAAFASHKPLFQALLYSIRAHSGKLRFSWTHAHADDDMNNRVDLLAKQGLLPTSPALHIADISAPPRWIDNGLVLNCQSLAFLTDVVVASSPSPFLSPKFTPFSSFWSSHMLRFFSARLDPAEHVPLIWSINIPVGLRELLYKRVLSALPIGDTWHGDLTLGQTCRCCSTLSLEHIWASCPSYDLRPLLSILYDHFQSLHPGPALSAQPWLWPSPVWFPLISLRSLDNMPANHPPLRRTLGKSRSKREWAFGSFLWFVWKHRMKEVHDPSYRFIPELHTAALNAALSEEPTLSSHSR